jgi:hypothetical protein
LAVLYSNAAACFFELRLYTSCATLSEISCMLDPSYSKGYYRKLRSLLMLRGFETATPLLLTISNLLSKADFDNLNETFTHLHAQHLGVFNWHGLLKGTVPQGEYAC